MMMMITTIIKMNYHFFDIINIIGANTPILVVVIIIVISIIIYMIIRNIIRNDGINVIIKIKIL